MERSCRLRSPAQASRHWTRPVVVGRPIAKGARARISKEWLTHVTSRLP